MQIKNEFFNQDTLFGHKNCNLIEKIGRFGMFFNPRDNKGRGEKLVEGKYDSAKDNL